MQFLSLIIISLLCLAPELHSQSLKWERVLGSTAGAVNCLVVDSNSILAGTADRGVYRSTDGGLNWQEIDTMPVIPRSSALWGAGPVLIAGTFDSGIYRSTNSGATWDHSTRDSADEIWTLFAHNGSIFSGTVDSGMFRSADSGLTWQQTNTGIIFPSIRAFTALGGVLFAGTHGAGIYRSIDDGNTWESSSNGLPEGFIHAMACSGTTVFAGTHYDAIYRSTDSGTTWTHASNGIGNPYIIALAMSGNVIFTATSDGFYSSNSMGDTWGLDMQGIPDSTTVLCIAISAGSVLAGTSSCGLFRAHFSSDGIERPVTEGLSSLSVFPNPVSSIAIVSSNIGAPATQLTVYDALGHTVLMKTELETQSNDRTQITLDCSNIPPGIYTIRIVSGEEARSVQFVTLRH